jgi:hypothetical protein
MRLILFGYLCFTAGAVFHWSALRIAAGYRRVGA